MEFSGVSETIRSPATTLFSIDWKNQGKNPYNIYSAKIIKHMSNLRNIINVKKHGNISQVEE